MRITLSIIVLGGTLFSVLVNPARGAIGGSDSVYAQPVSKPGELPFIDQPRLIDTGTDAFAGAAQSINDRNVRPVVGPQSSVVEAIPTPTAFHAGGFLLLLIAGTRFFRKFRWA